MANVACLLTTENGMDWLRYAVLGVCGAIVLIAFICGIVKGYSNFSRRPTSWAFGCAVFVLLEALWHEENFLLNLFQLQLDPVIYSFASTIIWLVAALLARWLVFGLMSLLIKWSKESKKKKAAKIAKKIEEEGEEILPDENKEYKGLPADGVCKPGAINRLFGGVFAALNTAAVLTLILSLAMLVIDLTPLRPTLGWLYAGELGWLWQYVPKYTLDFVVIAFIALIIVKGYKVGALYGVRKIGIFLAYIAALVGSFWLPFSSFAAEGGFLAFLGTIAQKGAALLPEMIPLNIGMAIFQVVEGIVLAIVLCLLVKLLGWLLGKLLDFVDNVPVLYVIDGAIGAVVYTALAFAIVAVIITVLYILEHYGVFAASSAFTSDSPIMGGAFALCDKLLRPFLEELAFILM
ncbi:MAG: hypothetical protein IJX98_06975 [Clostridia bacterium]|nr:hypothetical protein [Clostridia bacterium]